MIETAQLLCEAERLVGAGENKAALDFFLEGYLRFNEVYQDVNATLNNACRRLFPEVAVLAEADPNNTSRLKCGSVSRKGFSDGLDELVRQKNTVLRKLKSRNLLQLELYRDYDAKLLDPVFAEADLIRTQEPASREKAYNLVLDNFDGAYNGTDSSLCRLVLRDKLVSIDKLREVLKERKDDPVGLWRYVLENIVDARTPRLAGSKVERVKEEALEDLNYLDSKLRGKKVDDEWRSRLAARLRPEKSVADRLEKIVGDPNRYFYDLVSARLIGRFGGIWENVEPERVKKIRESTEGDFADPQLDQIREVYARTVKTILPYLPDRVGERVVNDMLARTRKLTFDTFNEVIKFDEANRAGRDSMQAMRFLFYSYWEGSFEGFGRFYSCNSLKGDRPVGEYIILLPQNDDLQENARFVVLDFLHNLLKVGPHFGEDRSVLFKHKLIVDQLGGEENASDEPQSYALLPVTPESAACMVTVLYHPPTTSDGVPEMFLPAKSLGEYGGLVRRVTGNDPAKKAFFLRAEFAGVPTDMTVEAVQEERTALLDRRIEQDHLRRLYEVLLKY